MTEPSPQSIAIRLQSGRPLLFCQIGLMFANFTTLPRLLAMRPARGREKNDAYRTREYLTEAEIEQLLKAAGEPGKAPDL